MTGSVRGCRGISRGDGRVPGRVRGCRGCQGVTGGVGPTVGGCLGSVKGCRGVSRGYWGAAKTLVCKKQTACQICELQGTQ